MDPNSGRIVEVADSREARMRGLVPVRRDLTPQEASERKVGFSSPCGCGSGKKFKRCCYGKQFR